MVRIVGGRLVIGKEGAGSSGVDGAGRAVRIVGVILVGGAEGTGSRRSWEQRELGAGSRGLEGAGRTLIF